MGETARLLDPAPSITTHASLQPHDGAPSFRKDGAKGSPRTTKEYNRSGRGDAILDMPISEPAEKKEPQGLAPDIVVEDGDEPTPVHRGGRMDQGGKGSTSDKLPIVLLQGFFRGPGAASPHHRRPSVTVNELTLPPHLIDVTSIIRGALPVLPRSLAALCLTLNILLPGLGTAASGWLGLCWGRNRMGMVETSGARFTSVVVTGATGLVQLFTVTFFLVGWFWGVAWGILLVSIANKYKQFLSEHRTSVSGAVNLEMLTVNAS